MSPSTVTIESLDNEGRGVARVEGKTVFVEGALPGERVVIETRRRKPSYEIARAVAIARPSASRIVPQPASVRTRWFSVSVSDFPSASVMR